jgi:hypothetical protein
MSLEIVNEESTAYLTVVFKDKDGAEQAPTSATYRIDCLTNGEEVREDTAMTPIASPYEITLGAADNAMIDSDRLTEARRVTVEAVYGSDDHVNADYKYLVKNLGGVE